MILSQRDLELQHQDQDICIMADTHEEPGSQDWYLQEGSCEADETRRREEKENQRKEEREEPHDS